MSFVSRILLAMIILAFGCTTTSSESTPKNNGKSDIWGEDDRQEAFELANDEAIAHLSQGTVALISNASLERDGDVYRLSSDVGTYGEEHLLCAEEPFFDQPAAAGCTGFLVGPDLVMTASHCFDHQKDKCRIRSFVFGYKYHEAIQDTFGDIEIDAANVYECGRVVGMGAKDCSDDWAVIKLDREVVGYTPLDLRRDGTPNIGDKVVAAGHPRGLPQKIATEGELAQKDEKIWHYKLDTFQGNSGSPIFDPETRQVESIMVCDNEGDFHDPNARGCNVTRQCENGGCRVYEQGFPVKDIAAYVEAGKSWPFESMPLRGDVFFTEIRKGDGAYLELHNRSDRTFDLFECSIQVQAERYPVVASTPIQPGQHLLISNENGDGDLKLPRFSLPDAAAVAVILQCGGFTDVSAYQAFQFESGETLSLGATQYDATANDREENWCESEPSPGLKNPPC